MNFIYYSCKIPNFYGKNNVLIEKVNYFIFFIIYH